MNCFYIAQPFVFSGCLIGKIISGMSPKDAKYIIHWENHQAKGKFQYLLLNTLVWGTLLGLMIRSLNLAWKGQLSLSNLFIKLFSWTFLREWLLSLGLVLGCSALIWYKARKKYAELKARQEAERR